MNLEYPKKYPKYVFACQFRAKNHNFHNFQILRIFIRFQNLKIFHKFKFFSGLVCNRWRRGATVICGCATETPKHGSRPRCMVSTAYPFDSYTCTYACNRGYTLEGVNMRQCLANQQWDTDLPRCVPANNKGGSDGETKVAPRPKMNPETRSMKKVCKAGF